jgi:hypothetical protein
MDRAELMTNAEAGERMMNTFNSASTSTMPRLVRPKAARRSAFLPLPLREGAGGWVGRDARNDLNQSSCAPTTASLSLKGRGVKSRRGVASVLAMMFLVVFSSLAAAMAVVAQGNLRTADSAMKVSRAMSAAETGLVFAANRLKAESRRFVVTKGVVDADFAEKLWLGTYSSADGEVTVLPPTGYTVSTPPDGIIEAVRDAHLADTHNLIIEPGDSSLPDLNEVTGALRVQPIALADIDLEPNAPYFRLKYELLESAPYVRVTSQGVDGNITRTLQLDFKLTKRIEFAVLSVNRIMIGKNVLVEGPLGSRFGLKPGELDTPNGDPLVMRSDFYHLDSALDDKLDTFFTQLVSYDVDGDGRLRPGHAAENEGLEGEDDLVDHDVNEYVDDFDLFLAHYDSNNDRMVVYDAALAAAAGLGNLSEEFVGIDDQLARLIDTAKPDRDGDGVSTFTDVQLGYNDGVMDALDQYAKVRGRLAFAVQRDAWDFANGASYQTIVHGPALPGIDVAPVTFEVSEEDMGEITTDMFDDTQSWFAAESAASQDFATQVAAGETNGGTFTPVDPATSAWEAVPLGAKGAYDYYQRPVYENMTFTNVRIPKGTNGLFINCQFRGVTYIETEEDCDHYNWNFAGVMTPVQNEGEITYAPMYDSSVYAELDGAPVPDTRVHSNNVRFHNCSFLGSIAGDKPAEYMHYRNKVQITGPETRFYIDADDPDLQQEPQAVHDAIVAGLATISADDKEELEKSSVLMPGWSVDVGNFNNEDAGASSKLKLKGTIIAGVLDVRGTADVHGTLLMTFSPTAPGEILPDPAAGPLAYGGQPDAFNTTIGYFGATDGDGEGIDPSDPDFDGFGEISLRYNPDAKLPDGIPWPVSMEADPLTYYEGGSM